MVGDPRMLRSERMPRFVAKGGNDRGGRGVALAGAALIAVFLPGCPLSDSYYVDVGASGGHTAATGGETTVGGASGAGRGGKPAFGGNGGTGAVGGAGGATVGGSGGTMADGGTTASGGGAATGATGGSSEVGGSGGKAGSSAEGGSQTVGGTGGTAGTAGCVMETERCDGIDNDCDDDIDEGAVCPDGCSVEVYDDHRYILCIAASKADGVTTDDAAARCDDLAHELDFAASFHLTAIESQAENDFLRTWLGDSLSGTAVVWIGANDRTEENTWVWDFDPDGEQFFVGATGGGGTPYKNRYNDWYPGSPRSLNGEDQDCGSFDTGLDLHWDDRSCDSVELGFICEERVAAASP